jgi:hypothetical protein
MAEGIEGKLHERSNGFTSGKFDLSFVIYFARQYCFAQRRIYYYFFIAIVFSITKNKGRRTKDGFVYP